jgi:hypothetical protein
MKHALARSHISTPSNGVTHDTLTRQSFDALRAQLEGHGNQLSQEHTEALFALCGLFTESAQGKRPGRWAFSLPTGMGKTSAIVAWCSTLSRLGLDHISVAVSASKIEALVELKLAMMRQGVPEERIGLLYAPNGNRYELPPTEANDDRQIMLVAHNRIRMRDGHDLFMQYRGKRRDLLIWDESLLASDSYGVSVREMRGAILWLEGYWQDEQAPKGELLSWLRKARDRIEQAVASAPADRPMTLSLPELDDASLIAFRQLLPRRSVVAPVVDLLDFCREELRVLPTNERGVIWYQMAVPREIQNIIVLDASYPVRQLVQADTTIKDAEEHLPPVQRIGKRLSQLKRYDNVTLHQLFAGGGRETMQRDFEVKTERRAAREVVEVVKDIPADEAVLVFTFKDRLGEDVNYKSALLRGLSRAGIDIDAKVTTTIDGQTKERPRINIATWGQETSLNRWAHCSNVILCGVLQRSSLDLAASFIGQSDNLLQQVSTETVKGLARSEVAHVVYQALSRGSCRVMDNGQAKPMKGWIIHRDVGIQPLLSSVMPGVRWEQWKAQHLTTAAGRQPGAIASTVTKIVAYLRALPEEVDRVSTKKLKVEGRLGDVPARTFTHAVGEASSHVPWLLSGRSLVRAFPMPAEISANSL